MKLLSRSEYFKTAMETGVGEKTMFIEVKECPHHVLDTRAAQLLPTHPRRSEDQQKDVRLSSCRAVLSRVETVPSKVDVVLTGCEEEQ